MLQGDVIAGRFEIKGRAGSGGMGTVYRAVDRQSSSYVALKVIHQASPDATRRFEIEARALAGLSHPHVVRYVTSGRDEENQPFLVMEWLEGEDLAARLARAPLTVEESLLLARGVAEGLGAAHMRGIVHRDVKPTNLILVGGDVSKVKLVDFGLARLSATSLPNLTRSGMIVGTPGYMSPEQASGDGGPIDARSDVFSLGAVLFECLAGKPPFQGDNLMALFAKLLLQDAPRLAEARPDLPPALDALVTRMLAKDPAKRLESGREVSRELAALDALGTEETAEVPTLVEDVAPGLTDVEARLVSVLAIVPESKAPTLDPLGSTQRTAADVLASVRAEVGPLGARVFELANGAIVVTLLGAGEPTDRAARAARSALRLRALLPDAPIALATGRAEDAARLPVGDVVDRVARLLEAERDAGRALVGVRIDDVTQALLDARFEVVFNDGAALGRAELRPKPQARLIAERASVDSMRTLLGKPSPFVGRERELRMARDLVEAAFDEERSHAIVLVGPAGIGKSRLHEELVARIRQDRPEALVARGRGDLLGQGSSFSLFGSALRHAAGIAPGEGRERLVAFVRTYLSGEDAERVVAFVGEMLGFPGGDALPLLRASRQDPSLMKDRIREAVVDLLAAIAKRRPIVLALEDVHWGDAASMRLVDVALRELSSSPFVVVLVARPEALTLFPRLAPERTQEIRIGELPRKAGEKLARHALGDSAPERLVRSLVERALGSPFCLEELVRAVSEGRGDALPETVLGMVEARLAALDPASRRVLRAASVFGEVFPVRGVLALFGDDEPLDEADLGRILDGLVEREIVQARRERRLAGEDDFAFRHALLRECAHAMLTDRDRALGHRLAGVFLESHGERDPKVLATHFDRGGDAARAIPHYVRAAEHALAAGDDEAALRFVDRGLALGAGGDSAAALLAIRTDAWAWSGDHARAYASAEAVLALATKGSHSHCRALGNAISHAFAAGKADERARLEDELARVVPLPDAVPAFAWASCVAVMPHLFAAERERAERLITRLEQLTAPFLAREPAAAAWVKMTRAFHVRYVPRDFERALVLDLEALAHFTSMGESRYVPYVRMHVGLDLSLLGAFEEAENVLSEAVRAAEPGSSTELTSRVFLYRTFLYRGRLDEATSLSVALTREAEAKGGRIPALSAALLAAEALIACRDFASARRELDAYEATAQAFPFARMTRDALLASLAMAERKPEEALFFAERAAFEGEHLGMYSFSHDLAVLRRAEALHALGREGDARSVLSAARDELFRRAARMTVPARRQSFLERVPTNSSILRAAALASRASSTKG